MCRGRVFNPFPGAGGFNWSISKIDAGGLDGSLAVVDMRFTWGVFVLVRPCAVEGVQNATKCKEGLELVSSLLFGCCCWLCQGWDPCH
jgi:hypothetical protein